MKLFQFIISVLTCIILWDFANCLSVNDVVTMAIDQVKPHHCTFWKKLFLGGDKKTKNFNNYQIDPILNNLMKTVPTTLIDCNNPPKFMFFNRSLLRNNNVIYEYNINISAPLHIIFFDDKVIDLKGSLSRLLKQFLTQ